MAMRIRTIKPEFWRNRKLASLGREIHDFAARLITASDDEGFAEADPALLAGDLYPFDTDAQRFIRKALPELVRVGFITIQGGEHGILCLPKFREHQRINRPSPSRLRPRFEAFAASFSQAPESKEFSESSLSPHGALSEPSRTEVEVEREVEQGRGRGTGSMVERAQPTSLMPTARDLAHMWNITTTPPLPRVDEGAIGKLRTAQLEAALKRRALPEWRRIFELVNASAYCRGSKGWRADIDWATRPEGKKPEPAVKILEGAFADAAPIVAEPTVYAEGNITL